jgi:hypothetical protein
MAPKMAAPVSATFLAAALLLLSGCIKFSDEATFEPCDQVVEVAPACAVCIDEHCSESHLACREDALCCEDYGCLASCKPGDAACRMGCLAAPGRRTDLVKNMYECRASSCAEACMGTEEVSFGWPETCEACMNKSCWKYSNNCALHPGCEVETVCEAACPDPACFTSCWTLGDPEGEWVNECRDLTPKETTEAEEDVFAGYWDCLFGQCRVPCEQGLEWGCVGNYRWPAPAARNEGIIKFTFHVIDMVSAKPMEGVTVSACTRADIDCAVPIFSALTDEHGNTCLDLPANDSVGFGGYFKLTRDDLAPVSEQYGRPIFGNSVSYIDVVTQTVNDVIWKSLGVDLDPDRGIMSVLIWDCSWTSAPGVTFELSSADEKTKVVYYSENGTLSFTQTETSSRGAAGFVNVPASKEPARIVARLKETGEIVGCHEVVVRPGLRLNLTLYPLDTPNFGCPGGVTETPAED